jgi:peptidoglycan/xylan/chitin deacetylase (PgdA/CDA1 family)
MLRSLRVGLILGALLLQGSSSPRDFFVTITVDVEGAPGTAPFDNLIMGKLPGVREQYGVGMIMDLCEKHNVKATFFVDVYEYRLHGEERMRELVQEIHRRGHDVELHTHPAWPANALSPLVTDSTYSYGVHSPDKIGMKQYGLAEQVEIIEEGIHKLEAWGVGRPVAHRAGDLAADYNTLKALARTGIRVDSSMAYRWPNCALNDPLLTRNKVVSYESEEGCVMEIPVTRITLQTRYLRLVSQSHLDWCTRGALEDAVQVLRDSGVNPVVVLLHSWSLTGPDANFTRFHPEQAQIQSFDKALSWLTSQPGLRVVTMKELAEMGKREPALFAEGKDDVPTVLVEERYFDRLYYSVMRLGFSWRSRAFVAAHLAALCVVAWLAVRFLRRRKGLAKPTITGHGNGKPGHP